MIIKMAALEGTDLGPHPGSSPSSPSILASANFLTSLALNYP